MATHEQFAEDLELYMLGELEPARAAEFRTHLDACLICQRELQQLRSDAALYALSAVGPAPPARARERFIRAVESESRATKARPQRNFAWIPSAVAAGFAVVALLMFAQNMVLKRTLGNSVRQNHALEAALKKQDGLLAAFNSPGAIQMTLTAAKKPQPQGRVIYVPKRGAVLFVANYFAPAPESKVYQLWLVPASGDAPMPCGTFKPDEHGMASFAMEGMPADVRAKTFAVTMEPAGGSQKPTMPLLMVAENRFPTE